MTEALSSHMRKFLSTRIIKMMIMMMMMNLRGVPLRIFMKRRNLILVPRYIFILTERLIIAGESYTFLRKPVFDQVSMTFLRTNSIPPQEKILMRNQLFNQLKKSNFLVLLVLMQKSEGGALGIGVSQESFMFSRSAGNFMTKATAVVATLFIICSLGLTILSRGDLAPTSSVLDTIEEKTEDTPSIPENNN